MEPDGGARGGSDGADLLEIGLARAFAPPAPASVGESVLASIEGRPGAGTAGGATGGPAAAGRYRLGPEVGRGGVGVVYEGRDLDLLRDVAIKVLRPDRVGHGTIARRFEEEARLQSRLEHPGIPPVFDAGTTRDAVPWYAMRLVRGRPLAHELRRRRDPADQLPRFLRIYLQACETVAYAHAQGVVHRDLKPQNILVGSYGEVEVIDWGFASTSDRDTAPERGTVLGTPGYMAPEQARGEASPPDPRTDVFALGAVLTEILTGAPAQGAGPAAALALTARADLGDARTRLAACGGDAELVDLALRCLEPAPSGRPRDAGEVAAAVRAHRDALETRARHAELVAASERALRAEAQERARLAERTLELGRVARRRRAVVAVLVAVAAIASAGLGYTRWNADRRRADRAVLAVDVALRDASRAEGAGDWQAAVEAARRATAAAALGATPEVAELAAATQARLATAAAADRESATRRARDDALVEATQAASRLLMEDAGPAASDAAYAAAFRAWGLDLEGLEAEAIASRLAGTAHPLDVAAALERWAVLRKSKPDATEASWRPLAEAGGFLAPDPWRKRLLAAALAGDKKAFRDVALEARAERREVPLPILHLLGSSLSVREVQDFARPLLLGTWRRHPGDASVHRTLASAFGSQQTPFHLGGRTDLRSEEAVGHALAAVALRPDHARSWSSLARALLLAGERVRAEAAVRRAIALAVGGAPPRDDLLLLADVQQARGRHAQAVETLRSLDGAPSASVDVLSRLATSYRVLGRHEESLACLDAGLAARPDEPVLLVMRGSTLLAMGQAGAAEAVLRRAIAGNRLLLVGYSTLASALMALGRPEEAWKVARAAMRAAPESLQAVHDAGVLLQRMGAYADSVPILERAVALAPRDAEAWFALGNAFDHTDRASEAEVAFRRVLLLDPRHTGARTNLAWILEGRGAREEALEQLRQAIEDDPDLMEAWYYQGLFLKNAGRFAEALASLERAGALAPDDWQIHQVTGVLLCDGLGRYDEAVRHFRRVLELNAGYADAAASIGVAWGKKGDHAASAAAFREALAMQPASVLARVGLAVQLHQAGDWDAALVAGREALAAAPDRSEVVLCLALELTLHADAAVRDPAGALDLVAARPASPLGTAIRIAALTQLGRLEEADGLLGELAQGEESVEVPLLRALVRSGQGRAPEARAALAEGRHFLAQRPDARVEAHVPALLRLAEAGIARAEGDR